jgi:hypothetical protein
MADFAALLAARKKKTGAGAKPKGLNFNVVLEHADASDAGLVQLVREYDDEGEEIGVGQVSVPSSKKVGALTAALNKQNAEAGKPRTTLGAADAGVKSQLAAGEWVEEDEPRAPQGPLLAPGSRAVLTDLDGLSSSVPDPSKSREQLEAEEEARKLFHWTRKQALVEAETKAAAAASGVVAAPAEKKPAFFRPREMMEREGIKRDGKESLKELNNEQVFPSLGGAPRKAAGPASAGSVWGVVKHDVIDEFEVKHKDGIYLGADFLAAPTFEGDKPGYAFSNAAMGVGYYWEGPEQANAEPGTAAAPIADQDSQQQEHGEQQQQELGGDALVTGPAPAPAPAPAAPTPTPSPAMLDAKARAAQAAEVKRAKGEEARRKEEEEKEVRRKAKKAEKEREKASWEAEQQRLTDKEAAEAKAKLEAVAAPAAPAAPAAAATDAPADEAGLEDRFAGLKKKKKKPAAVEEAEE